MQKPKWKEVKKNDSSFLLDTMHALRTVMRCKNTLLQLKLQTRSTCCIAYFIFFCIIMSKNIFPKYCCRYPVYIIFEFRICLIRAFMLLSAVELLLSWSQVRCHTVFATTPPRILMIGYFIASQHNKLW